MGLALALEDFDVGPMPSALSAETAGPSPEWLSGFAEGRAEALAEAAAEQSALTETLVRSLEDAAFGVAEVRGALLAELESLFSALSRALMPALDGDILVAHLLEALIAAARTDLAQPLVLRVSVADVVSISDRLSGRPDLPFTCRSDPTLAAGSALLSGAKSETSFDAAQLVQDLRHILSAFIDDQRQEAAHG